jgi:hypothetical protein
MPCPDGNPHYWIFTDEKLDFAICKWCNEAKQFHPNHDRVSYIVSKEAHARGIVSRAKTMAEKRAKDGEETI